ncbi:MAG TPA: type III ribulose-bisphosphate carboxylase [Candidatus Pacearchaeota archaeon]|nr:type III ribulose-bisphosphate carboxylase [Candidatus Pacearchaeota archaeon]
MKKKKEEFEFIDLNYKPKNDLICLFKIMPRKNSEFRKAANTVALESSVGTWTKMTEEREYVRKLRAKVFSIRGNWIKVAYPQELFESDNVPNILSSIAGNILGMKIVKAIRLEDVSFPEKILKSFQGPRYGIEGIRKFMKVKKRPLVGTIIKPKLGLITEHHAQSAYESWVGGCDIVKDDENLASQEFNEFEKRLSKTLEMADRAKSETGEEKAYLVNVTAETKEMMKRAQLVENQGGKYVMLDIITAGWAALQTLREANFKMALHAHRAMHAAMDRDPDQGVSMMVLGDFARLIGVDQIHVGTGIGKLEGNIMSIKELKEDLEKNNVMETKHRLQQKWGKIKPVLGVSSGGLYPRHIPFLVKHLGKDLVIQAGGGIHGHPSGTIAGAIAMRQAVDAVMKSESLKEYSKDHKELREALEFWKGIKW